MTEILVSILAILLIALMFLNCRKGIIISFLVNSFFIPGQVNIVGGIRFKFVILAGMIFVVIANGLHKKQDNRLFVKPAVFYLVYGLALAFLAASVPLSMQLPFLIKMWVATFAYGIILWMAISSQKYLLFFEKYFLLTLFVLTILGIVEYITSVNIFRLLFGSEVVFFDDARGGFSGRISSSTGHPLDWGQACVVLFGMALLLFNKVKNKHLLISVCILIAINCVLSVSRSCIIPLALFIVLYAIMAFKNIIKRNIGKVVISVFALIILFAKLNPENAGTVQALLMPWSTEKSEDAGFKGSSVELREEQLDNSIDFIGERGLLFGMGYGLVHNRPEDDGDLFDKAFGLESIIFVTVIEQGIVGLLCLAVFFVMMYKISSKVTHDVKRKRILMCLLLCYVLSLVFTGNRSSLPLFYTLLLVYMRHEQFMCSANIYRRYEKNQSYSIVPTPVSSNA